MFHNVHNNLISRWQLASGIERRQNSTRLDLQEFRTLETDQNGGHFAEDLFKCIFLKENTAIYIQFFVEIHSKGQLTRSLEMSTALLTDKGRDKMADIFQTAFSNAFCWMKMYDFRQKFHWSLFLWVQ